MTICFFNITIESCPFSSMIDGLWWFMMIYDDLCTQKWQWHKSVLSISVPLNPITAPCHPWVSLRCWAGPLRNSTRVSLGAFQWSWGTATAPKAVHTQKYHQKRESLKCCQPKWNYQNYQNNKHITNENLPLIWSTFSNALCSDPVLLNGK